MVWLELDNLLLPWAHQPAFSAWLSRWFVGDAVTGQVGGARLQQKTLLQSTSCRSDAPKEGCRMPARTAGRIEQKVGQASRPKWRSGFQREQDRWMSFVLCARKRSFSQSKRGLREASGGLGLRPLSNQGKSPLHWSMLGFRPCTNMSRIFLFLQQ